jgi:hypothetical protein
MVYLDAEGRQRHVKTIDEKLVERPKAGAAPGKRMQACFRGFAS